MYPITNQTEKNFTGNMVVVESKYNLEREIDGHVERITSLIGRLNPTERQKYFNGLLAYILNGQIEMEATPAPSRPDYNKLSENELVLLEEMSGKLQELYNITGDTE
jgi:hypothetical protein